MSNVINLTNRFRANELSNLEVREISSKVQHDTTLSQAYTKNLGVLADPDFFTPVAAPLIADFNGAEVAVPNKKAIINGETGELVSVVGNEYRIIPNASVFGEFDNALAESGIDLTGAYKTVHSCNNGASTILGYSFPAYETTITDREVGDVVRLSVTALNSYDGTSPFVARFSQDRLICQNSMVGLTDISYFAGKHTKGLVVEHAVEKIKQSIHMFLENAETYKKWANLSVSDAEAESMFQRMSIKAGYKTEFNEKAVEDHMNQWRKESAKLGKNRWALYNTLTFWSTHAEVTAKSKARNNDRLIQMKREAKVLKVINQAGWFKAA